MHQLVANHFIAKPKTFGLQVNHIDGNPTNNDIYNLEWVTAKENIQHSIDTGLANREGSNNGRAKLDKDDVRNLLDDYHTGEYTQSQLAEMYCISRRQVGRIVNGEQWTHI